MAWPANFKGQIVLQGGECCRFHTLAQTLIIQFSWHTGYLKSINCHLFGPVQIKFY